MIPFLWFAAFVVALMLLLALRIPVAISMGLIGMAGTYAFVSPDAVVQIANLAYSKTNSFVLLVVPLFVLMGEIIAVSGLGASLFRATALWLRRLPGGLAIGTIAACAGFSAVCGSSPVTAATMGAVSYPEMIKHGYSKRLALGAAASGGTLGILIPPSIPMILYGVITDTSIGKLFLSGILPGLMMALLLSLTIVAQVKFRPQDAPRITAVSSFQERMLISAEGAPIIIIALMVIGSIYTGIATPTEAGALGATAAIVIGILLRKLKLSTFHHALDRTVRTTGMFMLLLIGGLFSSFVMTRMGVPQGLSLFLSELDVAPWGVILTINLFLLILGMFMDPMSILVIVVPIFLQTILAIGYDPIWFGVLVTIQIEIAAITPPVGFNLFVLRSAAPGSTLADAMAGSIIFVIPMMFGIVLLMLFPEIALYLPGLLK